MKKAGECKFRRLSKSGLSMGLKNGLHKVWIMDKKNLVLSKHLVVNEKVFFLSQDFRT